MERSGCWVFSVSVFESKIRKFYLQDEIRLPSMKGTFLCKFSTCAPFGGFGWSVFPFVTTGVLFRRIPFGVDKSLAAGKVVPNWLVNDWLLCLKTGKLLGNVRPKFVLHRSIFVVVVVQDSTVARLKIACFKPRTELVIYNCCCYWSCVRRRCVKRPTQRFPDLIDRVRWAAALWVAWLQTRSVLWRRRQFHNLLWVNLHRLPSDNSVLGKVVGPGRW